MPLFSGRLDLGHELWVRSRVTGVFYDAGTGRSLFIDSEQDESHKLPIFVLDFFVLHKLDKQGNDKLLRGGFATSCEEFINHDSIFTPPKFH